MRLVVIAITGLLLAACGGSDEPTQVTKPTAPPQATLTVMPVEVRGGAFVEGFRSTLEISGTEPTPRKLDEVVIERLSEGTRTVTVEVRPCSGNCGVLDPGFTCERRVTIAPREHVFAAPIVDVRRPGECSLTVVRRAKSAVPPELVLRPVPGDGGPEFVSVDRGFAARAADREGRVVLAPGKHVAEISSGARRLCRIRFEVGAGDSVEVTPRTNARCSVLHGTLAS